MFSKSTSKDKYKYTSANVPYWLRGFDTVFDERENDDAMAFF